MQLLTVLSFLSILIPTDGRHKQPHRPMALKHKESTYRSRRMNDKIKSLKMIDTVGFQAAITTDNGNPVCSATIVSSHFVLSSCARCLQSNGESVPIDNVRIMTEDNVSGLGPSIIEVVRVVLHPNCIVGEEYDLKHDLGIVQTVHEMIFTSGLSPVMIPWRTEYRSKKINWILAAFSPDNEISDDVKDSIWYTKVRILGPPTCRLTLNASFYDPTYNYCTPYQHFGRTDDCMDDFGASLVVSDLLVGILIHKFACGGPDSSASFTNVAYNGQWISETIQTLSDGMETAQEFREVA